MVSVFKVAYVVSVFDHTFLLFLILQEDTRQTSNPIFSKVAITPLHKLSNMMAHMMARDRGCHSKSSIASSLGVLRHDPPLPRMPPFLLRVCWQGPDACCAPPMTLPPCPVGGCLSVMRSFLIFFPAKGQTEQSAQAQLRYSFIATLYI